MANPIIEIKNISKCYRIGANREPYLSLRDEIGKTAHRVSSAFVGTLFKRQQYISHKNADFWALKDVSFSVQEGEAIGIIGRNGAGKSTLLKILSQITPPTKGSITMRGRVASLLEVGTGFHTELTGRENIFLNGTILGMTRREVAHKFDEIVAFSEVEKFLDTPVKRYSSGMYVRLAFAVAAHLEPEILMIDEVLAVGDTRFQKKCLGKMSDIAKGGRTVLFISHNMAAIQSLCTKCITLEAGRVISDSDVLSAIRIYMNMNSDLSKNVSTVLKQNAHITKLIMVDQKGEHIEAVQAGDSVCFNIECYIDNLNANYFTALDVYNDNGNRVFYCNSSVVTGTFFKVSSNTVIFKCNIPRLTLMPGTYFTHVSLSQDDTRVDFIENALMFTVIEGDFWGSGRFVSGGNPPLILVDQSWSITNQ
jgi:lipopolysaccharide transport system ATP-binding protein